MDWDQIIAKLKVSDHFVCIQRAFPDMLTQNHFGEIGFSTADGYFLYVLVELSLFNQLVTEFKLEAM